jgi:hypothetical protein
MVALWASNVELPPSERPQMIHLRVAAPRVGRRSALLADTAVNDMLRRPRRSRNRLALHPEILHGEFE